MPLGEIYNDNGYTYYRCSRCALPHESSGRAERCCSHTCGQCGAFYNSSERAEDCCASWVCIGCDSRWYSEDDAYNCCEEGTRHLGSQMFPDPYNQSSGVTRLYPEEVLGTEVEHILYIEPLQDRPPRPCSIEQELTAGGRPVAKMLYDLGLSDYDQIRNYSGDASPARIIVKEDGSLPSGGGEVVYSRYVLSQQAHTAAMSKALACINELKNQQVVEIGQAAGTHIHIGAYDGVRDNLIGPPQMASLYEIFSFAEDVLFRLAASGWPEHRGQSYSQPLVKMSQVSPAKIAQETIGSRYFSLSFTRLLNAARTCSCGACIAGGWHECHCGVLESGTVEWRIFNSVTDPKTLHAWTLLAHGLTAASLTHELGSLEPNSIEWVDDPEGRHAWIFGWILWNCPFTDPERQLIIDCARNSPRLNINWDEFDRDHGGWGQLRLPAPVEAVPPFDLEAARQRLRLRRSSFQDVTDRYREAFEAISSTYQAFSQTSVRDENLGSFFVQVDPLQENSDPDPQEEDIPF